MIRSKDTDPLYVLNKRRGADHWEFSRRYHLKPTSDSRRRRGYDALGFPSNSLVIDTREGHVRVPPVVFVGNRLVVEASIAMPLGKLDAVRLLDLVAPPVIDMRFQEVCGPNVQRLLDSGRFPEAAPFAFEIPSALEKTESRNMLFSVNMLRYPMLGAVAGLLCSLSVFEHLAPWLHPRAFEVVTVSNLMESRRPQCEVVPPASLGRSLGH